MIKNIRALSVLALMLIPLATLPTACCVGGDGDPEMEFGQTYEGEMAYLELDFWNLYVAGPGTVTIDMDVQPGLKGLIVLYPPGYLITVPAPTFAEAPMGADVTLTTYISEPGWCDITLQYIDYDEDIIDRSSEYPYTIRPMFAA